MNVTEGQKTILLKYMKENEDFARGRLRYSGGNKKKLVDMWLTISTSLNSVGCGPRKEPKEWQKTWRDWKSAVLKKCASNRSYASGTGGGPPKVLQLTELEEDLLATIDAESAGLISIPEGGNFDRVMKKGCMSPEIPKRVREENVPSFQSTPFERKHNSSKNKKQMIETAKIIFPSGSGIWDDSHSQAQELEDNIHVFDAESEIEDITINFAQDENVDPSAKNTPQADNLIRQGQGKNTANKRKETNASAAVELMREQMEIEQEQLKVSKDKMSITKEKLKFMKNATTECLNTLTNINDNLTLIREAIEKIVPSYLE